jgi:hypothetical protein
MQQGWAIPVIDEMDIFYYFDILAYRLDKKYKKNKTEAQKVIDML